MPWLLLLLAIAFEVCGTTCMKLSQGFTRPLPSVLIFVFYGLCFVAFTYALKKIDLSVAYAIWSGLGTIVIATIAATFFGETMGLLRMACIALVIAGVVGLNLTMR